MQKKKISSNYFTFIFHTVRINVKDGQSYWLARVKREHKAGFYRTAGKEIHVEESEGLQDAQEASLSQACEDIQNCIP